MGDTATATQIDAGGVLRAYRTRREWSLNRAATESGVNKTVIHRAETEQVPSIRRDALLRLLGAYGKTYDDWVCDQAKLAS